MFFGDHHESVNVVNVCERRKIATFITYPHESKDRVNVVNVAQMFFALHRVFTLLSLGQEARCICFIHGPEGPCFHQREARASCVHRKECGLLDRLELHI